METSGNCLDLETALAVVIKAVLERMRVFVKGLEYVEMWIVLYVLVTFYAEEAKERWCSKRYLLIERKHCFRPKPAEEKPKDSKQTEPESFFTRPNESGRKLCLT